MNPTKPPADGPQPGAGPNWPNDASHGSAPDDHAGGGGVDPAALAAGHEPDVFAVKPILSVPVAVVVTFAIAFSVAALAFYVLSQNVRPTPYAHPEAVRRGEQPLNERLLRIDRKGQDDNKAREVDQPRLEPLRRREADGQFYARPEMPTGNSPEIHPEEIRPDRVAALQRTGYVDTEKKFARIPIADAMTVAVGNKDFFPVRKDATRPLTSVDKPSTSNAGRATPPAAPKIEAKKEPEKKEAPKAPAPPEKK